MRTQSTESRRGKRRRGNAVGTPLMCTLCEYLRNLRIRLRPTICMCAVLLVSSSWAGEAASSKGSKRETREIKGLVLQVEPTRIILQSRDGQSVTLTTFDDYTERVTTGTQVTAWYYPQDAGPDVLKSLDYPPESLFVPVGEIQNRVHRIVLLPRSDVPDADGLYDAIRDYLHANFGWYVAPQYLAAEVTRKAQRAGSILDATDPKTGRLDLAKYLNKAQGVIPALASGTRSDAVLEIEVVQVKAPVKRLVASWDGVEQPVAGPGMRTVAKFSVLPQRGEVSAATVELKLWDARGKLLWRNRRGLALLQVLAGMGNRLRDRPLPEFLMNTQPVQAWLAAAFKSVGPLTYDSSTSKPEAPGSQ
jgi:hypothetical protein